MVGKRSLARVRQWHAPYLAAWATLVVAIFGIVALEASTGTSILANPFNFLSVIVFVLFGVSCGLAAERLRKGRGVRLEVLEGMRTLLDAVPDAMFVFDVGGRLHSLSVSGVELFGWSEEEAMGRPVWELFPPTSREQIETCLRSVEANGEHENFGGRRLLRGQRSDGSCFPMELSVCRKGTTGERLFVGFARDLTERLAEQARTRAMEAELMHLARLNAMGQMATTLAHELNQPLTAAANFMAASTRMLHNPQPDIPLITEVLRSGVEQTIRAGDIIRRLRAFIAKREPGRAPEDIAEILMEAVALAMAGSHDVTVSYEMEPHLAAVLIDRIQIQQVVVNLVRNAVEAMAEVEDQTLVIGVGRVRPWTH